jgi:hypothetical protein
MPSTTSSSLFRLLPSSTVMTPSLPTLSIASAMICRSIRRCWRRSSRPGDFLAGGGGLGNLLQLGDQGDHGLVDAALQVHRVHAGGHVLHAFAHDGLGQHGGGGGAVAGVVAGLGSDFLDHLRAHVLELVLELDLLGDRDTVLGDGGGAERALEHHVAALGAQGDLDRVGQDVHAFDHAVTGVGTEDDVFSCHVWISPKFRKGKRSERARWLGGRSY